MKQMMYIQGKKRRAVPAWAGSAFILLCILMTAVACITVTSDGDDRVQYKTSTCPSCEAIGADSRDVYWRVLPEDLPRWKRFANRWHRVYRTESFKTYKYPSWPSWKDLVLDAEKYHNYSLDEFKQLRQTCQTVDQIREYLRRQDEEYMKNNREMREKREKEEKNKMWEAAAKTVAVN